MRISEALLNESIADDIQNSLLRGLKPEYGPGTEAYENILKGFRRTARTSKQVFQKQDGKTDNSKLVWALRWYVLDTKMHFVGMGMRDNPNDPVLYTEKEQERVKKQAQQANIPFGDSGIRKIFPGGKDQFFFSLNHFLEHDGIGNTIRNMTFTPEDNPTVVLMKMQEVEDEWVKNLKDDERAIQHSGLMTDIDSGKETEWKELFDEFMTFPDGSGWFDLNRAFCKQEGESMGHCGNTASYKHSDTILSYRTPHKHKEGFWTPHLTFIMDGSGFLGEMKGYANKKPTEKYYNVIRALLLDDRIAGIKGGGYLPESNFTIWDLPDAEEIVKQKPSLTGDNISKYVENIGVDDTLVEIIQSKLHEGQRFIPRDTFEGKTSAQAMQVEVQITAEYPDLHSLIEQEVTNSMYSQLLLDGGTSGWIGYRDFEPWSIKDWAETLRRDNNKDTGHNELWKHIPEASRNILNKEFATVLGDELEEDILNNAIKYDKKVRQGSFGIAEMLVEAVHSGWREGIKTEIVTRFQRSLEDEDSQFISHSGGGISLAIVLEKPGLPGDSPNRCYVTAPLIEMVDYIVRYEETYGVIEDNWWSESDVNDRAEDDLMRSDVVPAAQFDVRQAAKDFHQSMISMSPVIKSTDEQFHISYYIDAKGIDPVADEYWKREEGQRVQRKLQRESVTPKKVFRLAQVLTGSSSKKGHDKLHKMCSRLGLSKEQCHKLTSKAGYT